MTKINMTTVKKILSLGFEPIAEYYEKQDTEVVEKLILYQKSNKILLLLPEKGQILYTSPYLSTNEDTHELENLSNVIEYMEAFPKIMKSRPVTTLTILDLPLITAEKRMIVKKRVHDNITQYNFRQYIRNVGDRRINSRIRLGKNMGSVQTTQSDKKLEEMIYPLFQELPQEIKNDLILPAYQKIKTKKY